MEGRLSSGSTNGSRIGWISPGSVKRGSALFFQAGRTIQNILHNLVRIIQELRLIPNLPFQPVGLALVNGSSDGALDAGR